jgi:hypothetical protein
VCWRLKNIAPMPLLLKPFTAEMLNQELLRLEKLNPAALIKVLARMSVSVSIGHRSGTDQDDIADVGNLTKSDVGRCNNPMYSPL